MFDVFAVSVLVLAVVMVAGCPPMQRGTKDAPGEYTVSSDRLLGDNSDFNINDELVYKTAAQVGMRSTNTQVSDRELAMVRCEWCHECGFLRAWDWDNFGSAGWNPDYVGDEWGPIVQRMMQLDNSFLQEEMLAQRVFEYLRDESLGVYDESADDQGATVIEVDALPQGAEGQAGGGSATGAEEPEGPSNDTA